jgi:dynein heavy chain
MLYVCVHVHAQALFRPCSMMIPDYALVAEVMLFSEGFEDSKALSRKMVKLYKLASEQLSQQDHYDFGESRSAA